LSSDNQREAIRNRANVEVERENIIPNNTARSGTQTEHNEDEENQRARSGVNFEAQSVHGVRAANFSQNSFWDSIFGRNSRETPNIPSELPNNAPILDRIAFAVFENNLQKLKILLSEYRNISLEEKDSHIPKLNWLLVESACVKQNEIALILIQFGADVNHYSEFVKLADEESFECYFVDMLIHMDNFELFEKILNKVDLTIYCVGLYIANNWSNPHLYQYQKYSWGSERYIEDYGDEYENNCRKRLLWCAIFCGWALKNNRPDILLQLKELSRQAYKANIRNIYCEDTYRFFADVTRRLLASKTYTTDRIIARFEAASHAPRFRQVLSYMQVILDLHINIYSSSFAILCFNFNSMDRTGQLMHFNETLNAIKGNVDIIRQALAWHMSYYYEYGGPVLLFMASVMGEIFLTLAIHERISCNGEENDLCENGQNNIILLSLLAISFHLYLLTSTIAARVLSLGYLEIGGTLESVINRAAINLVVNQYTSQQAVNERSPFVGFSFNSKVKPNTGQFCANNASTVSEGDDLSEDEHV
jgi:hypothetical protein